MNVNDPDIQPQRSERITRKDYEDIIAKYRNKHDELSPEEYEKRVIGTSQPPATDAEEQEDIDQGRVPPDLGCKPATDTLELWLKIAREATGKFCKWMDSVRSIKAVDRRTLEEIIADAIERSHEQPPATKEFKQEDCGRLWYYDKYGNKLRYTDAPATEQEWSDVDNKIELLCEKADKAMPQWFRKQLKNIFNDALAAATKHGYQRGVRDCSKPTLWRGMCATELPKAREGWLDSHPTTDQPVEVVTREDYDFLYEKANAAVTTHEKAWVKVLQNIADEYAQDMIAAQVELDDEREQVREWQQRFEQAAADSYAYAQQLLASQAAIAELQKAREAWAKNEITDIELQAAFKALNTIDLSALDKHDAEVRSKALNDGYAARAADTKGKEQFLRDDEIAEVRKPLVDALRRVQATLPRHGARWDEIDAVIDDEKTDRASA